VRWNNWTYLHQAVRFGSSRTVEILLQAGADPCQGVSESAPIGSHDSLVPDTRGMTPLELAEAIGNHAAVAVLEEPSTSC
jgi:ankyrin repeat protein